MSVVLPAVTRPPWQRHCGGWTDRRYKIGFISQEDRIHWANRRMVPVAGLEPTRLFKVPGF